MAALLRKDLSRISRAVQVLFSMKGILRADEWKSLPPRQLLSRELRLHDNRSVFMSDAAYESLRTIVSIIHAADVFEDNAEFSDVWSACRAVVQGCLANGVMPENGAELVAMTTEKVNPQIDEFTFVVPLEGVTLELEVLRFGVVSIVPSTADWLLANARKPTEDLAKGLALSMKAPCWLVGSVRGTYKAAERKIELLARLTAGLLGILAAATYEGGAEGFRIRAVMVPEDGTRSGTTLAVWSKTIQELSFARRMAAGQPFPLDETFLKKMNSADSVVSDAIATVQRQPRNDLEEAIVKAVYWYADAHLDSIEVMRFVKFWSCIETFFPAPKNITKTVCLGATAVLVYGPLRSIPLADYQATKTRLTALYGLRSGAVHHAKHDHVSSRDIEELSQWAAWLVLNVVALNKRGVSERSTLLEECQRLDNIETRAPSDPRSSKPIPPSAGTNDASW